MRLLALLVLALALAVPAAAQENAAPGNETPSAGNETPAAGNETGGAPTNATGNETGSGDPEPAIPAAPEPITIELEGVQEGPSLYFRKVGDTARNPTLTVQPGQKVTFVLTIASGVHNLNINGAVKTDVIGEGNTQTIEWTAPETPGALQYWCDPHRTSGMAGRIQVGASAPPSGGGEAEEISGPTVDLGQYDPNCAGKVAPASAANGEVGMPTLDDYIAKLCTSSDGGETQAVDPYKSADYVIPLSWLLIGVGVVGVVWVHKYYKP